jgi:Flp pilus assembly pilin Flp
MATTPAWCIVKTAFSRLVFDDRGQDLFEYALLAGLIGVMGAAIFPEIAAQMGIAYESWMSGAEAIWEPPPPGS